VIWGLEVKKEARVGVSKKQKDDQEKRRNERDQGKTAKATSKRQV
jgi:hypothetical protein